MTSVRLVAITLPVSNDLHSCGELIAYCARVSNPSNQLNHGTAEKLLTYMTDHQHWSPFEMVSATIEIITTRDIGRQILRHRSFSFQEFSQRYAEVTQPPVIREARLQDNKNRQNSFDIDDKVELKQEWLRIQERVAEITSDAYEWAIGSGIAKECARVILPEGMTESRMYMAGNLRSWIHYILLRSGNGTQKEHREIAEACRQILISAVPELKGVLYVKKEG